MTKKQLDKQIERIYYETCSGVQIPIMAISKIFEAGRKAASEGLDIKQAILDAVEKVRVN